MIQKKQPARIVKKKAKANSHEKLNCSRLTTAPTTQSPRLSKPTTASNNDKPGKRFASKYSPSGTGTTSERSLIFLAPPVSVRFEPPSVPRGAPAVYPPRWRFDCVATHGGKQ